MYISLSKGYAIRNELKCSFVVEVDRTPDTAKLQKGILMIPPFMGFILSRLGNKSYDEDLDWISKETGLPKMVIKMFVDQLIENPEAKSIKINEQVVVVFPPFFLRKYSMPQTSNSYDNADFDWRADFSISRPSIPFSVNLMVTTRCTTDCQYCYANRGLNSVLSSEELIAIVHQLRDAGVINLSLTGGDIFALEGWDKLLRTVASVGYNPFLSTKTPLSLDEIRILSEIGCNTLQFSMDSCDDKVLKKLIKSKNGYVERVRSMFDACTEYGIRVQTRTVLTSLNSDLNSIEQLYKFFISVGCISEWSLTPAFFSEYKQQNYKWLEPNNDQLEQLYPFLTSQDRTIKVVLNKLDERGYVLKRCDSVTEFVKRNTICLANSSTISILANGKVSVCEMLYEHPEFILGDIRENTLESIWNSEKALKLYYPIQSEVSSNSACSSCNVFDSCKRNFGKRVCYMDVVKSKLGFDGPDPRCPRAPITDKIL